MSQVHVHKTSDVSEALRIQCSSSTFYLLEEIGGYVLECRGTLQVKVRCRPVTSRVRVRVRVTLGPLHLLSPAPQQGKGDMVTYWLGGKTADDYKHVTMEMETATESAEGYASLPGFVDNNLILNAA